MFNRMSSVVHLWLPARRITTAACIALGCHTLVTDTCVGQSRPSLAEGARVRIRFSAAPNQWLVGNVMEVDTDHFTISNDTTQKVSLPDILALEVSQGTHRRTLHGMVVGLAIGVGVGLLLGQTDAAEDLGTSRAGATAAFAGFFGMIGAGMGAAGGSVSVRENWEAVPLSPR